MVELVPSLQIPPGTRRVVISHGAAGAYGPAWEGEPFLDVICFPFLDSETSSD